MITQTVISIPIIDDALVENGETFTVTLSSPAGATLDDATGVVTILDNEDAPTIEASNVTVAEDAGSVTVTFTLSTISSLDVSFDYATADGTATAPSDYLAASGRLTITAGMTQTTATFMIADDNIAENNEQFVVNLSNPSHAQTRAGLQQVYLRTAAVAVTILDDDAAGVTAAPTTIVVSETESAPFTITLDTQPTAPVTVTLGTDNLDCELSTTHVVLTPETYAVGVQVIVTGTFDLDTDDDMCRIEDTDVTSSDPMYDGLSGGPRDEDRSQLFVINVTIQDRDTTSIQLSTQAVAHRFETRLLWAALLVVTGVIVGRYACLERCKL